MKGLGAAARKNYQVNLDKKPVKSSQVKSSQVMYRLDLKPVNLGFLVNFGPHFLVNESETR